MQDKVLSEPKTGAAFEALVGSLVVMQLHVLGESFPVRERGRASFETADQRKVLVLAGKVRLHVSREFGALKEAGLA